MAGLWGRFSGQRRNLLIFALVISAVGVVGSPALRARLAEAVVGPPEMPAPNLGQDGQILDPSALKTTGQYAPGSNRGARASKGDIPLAAPGSAPSARALGSSISTLGLGSDDDASSGAADLRSLDDDSKAPEGLMAHYADSGLGSLPSQIAPSHGYNASGAGAAGVGLPGGFSSGVRPRMNGEAQFDTTSPRPAGSSHIVVVSPAPAKRSNRGSPPAFNPNTPFGPDALTAGADEITADDLAANQIDGVPVAAPEPGTLLLVANGVAAALGSRMLRRRRNKIAQQ